ncbi:MAG: hypothetical protein D6820_03935, partial [Lentisphaerae bacterium]
MNNPEKFMHYLAPSSGFRAVYNASMAAAGEPLCFHVTGYRMEFRHIVDVPAGVDCWFCHIIHTPIPIRDRSGLRRMEAPFAIIY